MGHDYEDPEQLKEILSVVSTEIPKLIESITKTMYNTENAENMAKSVAQFYKSMRDAGMDDSKAFALTQDFMESFSIGGMISKAVGGKSDFDEDDEIDDLIEKRIKEKLKEIGKDKKKEKSDDEED